MSPRWPAQWGGPGAVALLALVAAAPLAAGLAPHWQAQADALRQAQSLLPRRPAAVPAAAPAPVRTWSAGGDASERVATLWRLAQRHGVDIERSQQLLDRSGPLPRLQLGLVARGRYAELRGFVAAALQADPALALDRLQWRRATPAVDLLEADLQWSLLLDPRAETGGL